MLPPSLQDSLPAGWLAFAGRASTLWIATKGFRSHSHPPFLDLSWRKGSFTLNLPLTSFDYLVCAAGQRQWDGDAKRVGGLEMMTNSTLTTCWTGKSAGVAPLRILPA